MREEGGKEKRKINPVRRSIQVYILCTREGLTSRPLNSIEFKLIKIARRKGRSRRGWRREKDREQALI